MEQGVVTEQLVQHECRVHLAIFHSPQITIFGTVITPDGIQCRGVVRVRAKFREVARIKGRVGTIVSSIICGSRRRPSLETGARTVRFPEDNRIGVVCQFKLFRLRRIRRQISIRGIGYTKRQIVGHINRGKRLELDGPRQGFHHVHFSTIFHRDRHHVAVLGRFVGNLVQRVVFSRYGHNPELDASLFNQEIRSHFIVRGRNIQGQNASCFIFNKRMRKHNLGRIFRRFRSIPNHLFQENRSFTFNRQGLLIGFCIIAVSI